MWWRMPKSWRNPCSAKYRPPSSSARGRKLVAIRRSEAMARRIASMPAMRLELADRAGALPEQRQVHPQRGQQLAQVVVQVARDMGAFLFANALQRRGQLAQCLRARVDFHTGGGGRCAGARHEWGRARAQCGADRGRWRIPGQRRERSFMVSPGESGARQRSRRKF